MSSDSPISKAVCEDSELQEGAMKEVAFGEGKVLLSRLGSTVYATSSTCSHYGAPLAKGVLSKDGRVVCPWHGACFSVKTGDIEDSPGLDSLHTYKAEVKDGKIHVTADLRKVESKKGRRPTRDVKAQAKKSTEEETVVVIGGGSAGAGVVEGLRENGYAGKIVLFTEEPHGPIDRTKLSKALITDASKIALRPASEYESEFNVDLRTSTAVSSVDLSSKIVTANGKEQKYTSLVFATGATPRDLPVDGGKLGNVLKLRTVADAKKIDEVCKEGARVVFVGSSFISMEIAGAIAKRKLASVDVIGMESVPFEAVLGSDIGAALQKSYEGQGVKFHMKCEIDSFVASKEDSSKVGGVKLKDSTVIDCDAVILGIGAKPNTQLLSDAGLDLEKDGGVAVDEYLNVKGHKDVFAVGDIAAYPFRGSNARIEHWNIAGNHGRAVAATIALSEPVPFTKEPIFWSSAGKGLRYAGNSKGFDDVYIKGTADDLKFEAYYAKEGKVLAVATMGADPVMSKASELFRVGQMPSLQEIKGGKSLLEISI